MDNRRGNEEFSLVIMNAEQNDRLKYGYQPRPVPPSSAGRALSVLVAVCAVLWVWWMAPEWCIDETSDQFDFWQLEYIGRNGLAWFCLFPLGNWAVFRWSTRPLSALNIPFSLASVSVFSLSIVFHIFTLLPWVLLTLIWIFLAVFLQFP